MCLGNFDPMKVRDKVDYCLNSKINESGDCSLDEYCNYDDLENLSDKGNKTRILHINIRSLVKNLVEFKSLIAKSKPDIILVCETWLHKNNVNLCQLDNYDFIKKPRPSGKGGGIAIYILSSYTTIEIDIPTSSVSCNIECLAVKILNPKRDLLIVAAYRKPNTKEHDFIEFMKYIKNLSLSEKCELVIGTDQNIDLLKIHNQNIKAMLECISEISLTPTILKPTRVTKPTATLIDQIYVSEKLFRYPRSTIIVDDMTDHYPCIYDCYYFKKKGKQSANVYEYQG